MATQKATNAQMLNAIRSSASLDYQNRVPKATRANLDRVVKTVMSWSPARNEFMHTLVNMIGTTLVRNQVWNNPLSPFKRPMLAMGDTIQEIQIGLVKAQSWNEQDDYENGEVWKRHLPRVESLYHTISRQDMYPITVNHALLSRAFVSDTGLNDFVNALLSKPKTSDEYDEFMLMCKLFSEVDELQGFRKIKIPNITSLDASDADSKSALKAFIATAGNMSLPSTKYNPLGMETWSDPGDMYLFVTPEVKANLDVGALAALFNVELAQVPYHIYTVRQEHIGIPDAVAVLVHKDFFVVADTLLENTSIQNPISLNWNYWLHHHEIISASLFANAVVFTSGEATSDSPSTLPKVTRIDLAASDVDGKSTTTVNRGMVYNIMPTVTLDDSNSEYETALVFRISGNTTSATDISENGVLRIGRREKAENIIITARAENPAVANSIVGSLELTVSGATSPGPNP